MTAARDHLGDPWNVGDEMIMWRRPACFHDTTVGWYACEHPERPTDPYVIWHYDVGQPRCHGCLVAAQALLSRNPDDRQVRWLVDRLDRQAKGEWAQAVRLDPLVRRS